MKFFYLSINKLVSLCESINYINAKSKMIEKLSKQLVNNIAKSGVFTSTLIIIIAVCCYAMYFMFDVIISLNEKQMNVITNNAKVIEGNTNVQEKINASLTSMSNKDDERHKEIMNELRKLNDNQQKLIFYYENDTKAN